jgi:hypothetical protein
MSQPDPTIPTDPDNLRSAEVLATQTAMDTELADRHPHPATTSLTSLAKLLPSLAPPDPHDLAAARRLDPSALARRVADASSQLLHLPPSLLELQPSALAARQAAHQRTQAARTRRDQITQQLERQGRLRSWLLPQRTVQLRQQLRTVDQERARASQQLQTARLRLRAIELRQDQRRSHVTCHRLELREGAAAALVLAERTLARQHDRDTGRPPPALDQPPAHASHRPDRQRVSDTPERS